jgi:poly(ADP-ribose) glycohydrolase ARH3
MRAAPVALVARSLHHAAELGERSAEVTHAHKHGRNGAACQAAAAYLALHSDPARPLDATRFLHDLRRVVRSRSWHDKLDRVAELVRWDNSLEHIARALGNDVSALGSVPAALLAFLAHADDPVNTIRFAIRGGGDTDTIAAMAGALAGARHGAQKFPEHWLTRLEAAEQLRAVAQQLR